MKRFKPSILTLSMMAAGLAFASGTSYAQQEEDIEVAAQQVADEDVEVIEVVGFRGSVIKSLNTKRFSDTVVDAISADDIGGLPDVSIADSLTRLPGVTSIRLDGQSSELNIRGLSGGFVFSTLNGREQVSPSGGRAVQFDQFPSELINQAQVFKSQKASLIEGGVAGSVNLETANALKNDKDNTFRFSAHGNWNEAAADNEDSDTFGRRLTASYQGKFLDETVGVSIGFAQMFQPTVSSRFVNYQFDEVDLSNAYDGGPESILMSSGFETNERGGEDERNAVVLALNFEPRDDLRMKTDFFYSDFDSNKWDRGIRVSGLNNIQDPESSLTISNPIVGNGAIIGGTFKRDPNNSVDAPPYATSARDMNVQTQADDNSTESEVLSAGFNLEYDINDDLTMSFDVSHSEAEEIYKDQVLRMAYFEDSSVETPIIDDNIELTYKLDGLDNPYVEFNQDFTDLNHMMVTSSESYPHEEENSADAIRLDFEYQLDNDYFRSVEVGVRVSQREYEVGRGRYLYGTTDFAMRNGQYITYERNDDNELVEVERFAPFQLTSEFATATTINGDLGGMPGFLAIDNNAVLDAWLPNEDRTAIRRWDHDWTMTQSNKVEEDVTAYYFQVNIDAEVMNIPVTGNFGLRAVDTEQKSTGLVNVGAGNGDVILDDRGVENDSYQRDTIGTSYTDYLPSFNLNFSITDEDQIRFAYAKVLSRPEMEKMANSGNWRFSQEDDGNFIHLDSNTSPLIRPFYADQIDVSYEHYFSETDGAFIFAIWNKDIESFPDETKDLDFDFEGNGFPIPDIPEDQKYDPSTGDEIEWQTGDYNHIENNAKGGYIRGVEIAYTQTFNFLPGPFSGLGANLNFSYTESEIERPSNVPGEVGRPSPLEGLSPRVYSATVFYDYEETFSARVSARHRAEYLGRQIAIGSDQSAYFADETIVSAQTSYNWSENLQMVLSVDNLTDEPNVSYFGDTSRTGTIQYFGRTIYFGINYTM